MIVNQNNRITYLEKYLMENKLYRKNNIHLILLVLC